nr:RNA-directed DNA polymerase, eukaryota [Tanacetum cinerariifolium]
MNLFRSKEDHVIWISKSVFVTNFPDSFGSRDLWSLCEEYGKVGRLHLQANVVRYERPPKSSPSVKLPSVKSYAPFTSSPSGSFADAVKDIKNVPPHSFLVSCSPALVLDDTCVNVLDVSGQVMGRTKDVNSILNLRTILTNESFMDVKLSYLGGLWVMIELNSEETIMKLLQHTGVNSWFEELKPASQEFVCNGRIGTVMDIEESLGSSFARKRLCIKTKYKDPGYLSEDESSLDGNNNLVSPQAPRVNVHEVNEKVNSHHSDDPFGLYDLLRKSTNLSASKEDPSLSHPPGLTPVASHQDPIHSNSAHLEVNQDEPPITKGSSSKSYPKASCFSQASHGNDSSADSSTHVSCRSTPKGGSILEFLDGMIKVGCSMGYDMEGCLKDIEQIIRLQGEADALQETKMESISHMDVKSVWGNSNYQFAASGLIGNLGGILCVWEETIFKKVDVSISDNFIALYGIWLHTNSKILIVNGETIVLGDFNEVRSKDERFGSIFHQSYAREFNHFISSSGLLEVKMEGYSFTWSYSSASKMSKLDRFLVLEGIFLTFPTILVICLDRYLSDHTDSY